MNPYTTKTPSGSDAETQIDEKKKPATTETREEKLEHLCAMLMMFPGMCDFVGPKIFKEAMDLLGRTQLDSNDQSE